MIKRVCCLLICVILLSLASLSVKAQNIYTWIGANNGSWSTVTNWNPNTGYPGTGGVGGNTDVADINNVTATQNVTYDAGASGFLGSLNITQTSAFVNEVTLAKNLTLTNGLTLGASGGGTAEVVVPSGFTLTVGGNVTVNAGGNLSDANGALILDGSSNNLGSSGNLKSITLSSGAGTETLTAIAYLYGTTTIPNNGGTLVAQITDAAGVSGVLLKMTNNFRTITLQAGGNISYGSITAQEAAASDTSNYNIDANGHVLTDSNASGFTATTNNTYTSDKIIWTLTDSATGGIFASPSFNLSTTAQGTPAVGSGVSVAGDLILKATGTNATVNILSNPYGGTISGTSTFLYAGNAVSATPATLASSRTIGYLNVQNGVLELAGTGQASGTVTTGTQANGAADIVTINSGGMLMLGPSFTLGNTTAPLLVSGTGVFDLNGQTQTLGVVTLGDSTGGSTIMSAGTAGSAGAGVLNASGLTTGGSATSTIATNTTVNITGSASVSAGSILAVTGSLNATTLVVSGSLSGAATVGAGETVSGGGTITGPVTVTAGGALLANAPNLTVGNLSILSSGTFALSLSTVSGTTSAVTASNLTLNSGAVLTIADTGATTALAPGTVLDFLNYSGTALTSGFNYNGAALTQGESINLGLNTYTFSYDGTSGQDQMTLTVTSVPEPGAWGSVLGGMAMLGLCQRRKNRQDRD